jgi:hypothetical protein
MKVVGSRSRLAVNPFGPRRSLRPAIVNREDPVGLLSLGAFRTKYDPKARDLIKWRSELTAKQVSAVFLLWFGDSGAMPSDMAARIAMRSIRPAFSIGRGR